MADCSNLITNEDLQNAKLDANSSSEYVSSSNPTLTTRLGSIKATISGMNEDNQEAVDDFNSEKTVLFDDFDNEKTTALVNFDNEKTAALDDFQDQADNLIFTVGFEPAGVFEVGAIVTSAQQTLSFDGEQYRTDGAGTVTQATPTLDPLPWYNVTLEAKKTVARSFNVLDSEVGYGNAGEIVTKYLYDTSQQKTYSAPAGAQGKTIFLLTGTTLQTTVGGPYELTEAIYKSSQFIAGEDPLLTTAAVRDSFVVARALDGLTDCHAFADGTVIDNATDSGTYGTFDATTEVAGTHDQNHQFSFQDRAKFTGSGTINTWAAHISWPATEASTGHINTRYWSWVKEYTGLATCDNNIGLFIEDLTKGVGNSAINLLQSTGHSMYAPNAGAWLLGGVVTMSKSAMIGTSFPVAGVALTVTRGNVGDKRGFVSTNSDAFIFGSEGDTPVHVLVDGATRVAVSESSRNYALEPGSVTQDLGSTVKEWNMAHLKEVSFTPITSATASNLSLFVDVADGALKYKTSSGTLRALSFT